MLFCKMLIAAVYFAKLVNPRHLCHVQRPRDGELWGTVTGAFLHSKANRTGAPGLSM